MGTKTRDLSKLGAGFVVDGTKSRIDSDNTIETFTTLSVKRDNALYDSGQEKLRINLFLKKCKKMLIEM